MILIIGGASEGKTTYAKRHFPDASLIDDYQDRVRSQMADGADPMKEAEMLLEKSPHDLVVVTDEIGCGLVPVDASDRAFREASGRVNCFLAEKAALVVRVVCGIGVVLKDATASEEKSGATRRGETL